MKALLSTFIIIFLVLLTSSCAEPGHSEDKKEENTQKEYKDTGAVNEVKETTPLPFTSIEHDFKYQGIILPEGFTYEVLFSQGDPVKVASGEKYPARGSHDMVGIHYTNEEKTQAQMYISHETREINDHLGDGGGGTYFSIAKNDSNRWEVTSDYHHVDFSSVGGTTRNCGGNVSPNGTVYTCEESYPTKMSHIWRKGQGFRDTSDYLGRPRYENFGFIVEVDPTDGKVIKKHYQMGRFMHEDVEFMDDNRTVYMTDDYNPAVFFKYVADEPLQYESGQLYAYQQSEDATSGKWIKLPRDSSSLYNIRDVAIKKGATMFVRHEWMSFVNGKFYINETGDDDFDWGKYIEMGGQPAHYLKNVNVSGTQYDDVFGRVLVFDPETMKMDVHLEGGMMEDSVHCFSNPDGLTHFEYGGKTYLVIHEDINWYSRGRVSPEAEKRRMFYNEIYLLDLDIEKPQLNDLVRFAAFPKGSEPSGGIFDPDQKTFFVNVMHPWYTNKAPFKGSCTIAIYGF